MDTALPTDLDGPATKWWGRWRLKKQRETEVVIDLWPRQLLKPSDASGSARYTRQQESEVHMSKRGQHVVPAGDGWAVRKAGARRASGRFATQKAAIDSARKLAKKQRTELYIHGRDGKIRERDSYGSDPHSPKG